MTEFDKYQGVSTISHKIENVLKFQCLNWMLYPRVECRMSRWVWVYVDEEFVVGRESGLAGYIHRCRECWLCFGSKKRSLLHTSKGNFTLSVARNLPDGLQLTRGARILLRPDVLCAIPSHPLAYVHLTLQWNILRRTSFEINEREPYFAVAAISIGDILPQIPWQDLIRTLWRVNLMLALNRSLSNRKYILMNVLKTLSSIICMCNLH
jgi:hypothetical protein